MKEYRGWKCGTIKTMDSNSGQVEVEYKHGDQNNTYWTHLDNEDEIAEYGVMTRNIGKTLSDLLRADINNKRKSNEI